MDKKISTNLYTVRIEYIDTPVIDEFHNCHYFINYELNFISIHQEDNGEIIFLKNVRSISFKIDGVKEY